MSRPLVNCRTVAALLCVTLLRAVNLPAQTPPAPQFRFAFALDNEAKIHSVLVYRGAEQIQSLDICAGHDIPRTAELGELVREDFNFDGYPDLVMRTAYDPQTENSSYCIWLYDSNAQRFVPSKELSELSNPRPDLDAHTITAQKNERCAGSCYNRQVYKWQTGHLQRIREESLTEDPIVAPESSCRYVLAIKTQKRSKLVETSRQRVDSGGVKCEPHTPC